jgi:biotin transport system substrate-specific component
MKGKRLVIMPVLAALFAALISVGAYLAFPVPGSPVPIVLQNMFVMLAALLLGPAWGALAVAMYLGLGALGLPVFSAGTGGLARFMGPTGGFLLSYIPAAVAMGLLGGRGKRKIWRLAAASAAGIIIVYGLGIPWLRHAIKGSWAKAFAIGFLPYIGFDVLKAIVASSITAVLGPELEARLEDRSANA